MNNTNTRVLYLSHGGGPMPLLGEPGHKELVTTLKIIRGQIKKPSAILVISAHWEESQATITGGMSSSLLYDYSGFPEQAYQIKYPAAGSPTLSDDIYSKLREKGITTGIDTQRGFDHGLFVPLKIMYPEADIPCVQLSLVNDLDPKAHIKLGEALAGLAQENLLIIGSGFSFHNMAAFFQGDNLQSKAKNESFEAWLIETCSSKLLSEKERSQRLEQWDKAPSARYCHPREEHLLPLHVCYGVTKQSCDAVFELTILGKKASMYLW
ncbi:MAG: dioxygenase [Gammaproteobacteria bacterium]|nr:MAG: dioxygenase [Gammaproteobacteria bacterium]